MFHYGSVQNMTDKAAIFLQYLAFDTREESKSSITSNHNSWNIIRGKTSVYRSLVGCISAGSTHFAALCDIITLLLTFLSKPIDTLIDFLIIF